MIGDAVNRAVASARIHAELEVKHLGSRVMVGAVGGAITLLGVGFGLVALFYQLEPMFGVMQTALMIGAACLVVGLVIIAVAYRDRAPDSAPEIQPLEVAREEAQEIADYIGPIRLMATALSAGFTVAKFMKR